MVKKVFQEAADYISSRSSISPRISMVLGSGLNPLAERMEQTAVIPFTDIPHFPPTTVEGHAGRVVIGTLDGVPLLVMQGRYHFYEGYTMKQVTLPIRVMKTLGIEVVILTNAAGAINLDYRPGDMMLISDHIYLPGLTGNNPLMGPNDDEFGPRFPDMSHAYDPCFREIARKIAQEEGLPLHEGVYISLAGPSFETPAEVRFLRTIGADAVGMSTAPETVVAVHSGMRVVGISGISNAAPGALPSRTTHEEVLAAGKVLVPRMIAILRRLVPAIAEELEQ